MDKRIGHAGFLLGVLVLISCNLGLAQDGTLKVGDIAPPIEIGKWLNVDKARLSTGPALDGKVVLVDFWGTWCPPCVRAMPQIQRLHDRYRDRGLVVVALSYEDTNTMKPFIEKNAYTMPVASDTNKRCVTAYGVKAWPTTFLIDKEGKIAYVGGPYSIEPVIEKALGLESNPSTLLTRYLDALDSKKEGIIRDALLALTERSTSDFNLKEWAVLAGGVAQAESDKTVEGEEALQDCVEARKRQNTKKNSSILDTLATGGPESFDLRKWSRTAFGQAFPIRSKGVRSLLDERRYGEVLDALLERFADTEALSVAAGHTGLQGYCKMKSAQCRIMARKALMAQNWPFKERVPSDQKAFWRDLSISGISQSETGMIGGVVLGGAVLSREEAPEFIRRQLELNVLMDSLATGKPPIIKKVGGEAESLRKAILAELEGKYGGH
ncbi:MAG: TlpA family protein disulfide reductase [Planctomycetes bacterium]|nr:TlpA family protein disulfide reductase [Planctomycetota bacterium]